MAKAFIPKVNHVDIDLAEWGGEGIMRIKAMSGYVASELSSELLRRGKADGFTAEQIQENPAEFDAKYNSVMAMIIVRLCTQVDDIDGWRNLTEEEVEDLPSEFIKYLYEKIMEMNNFPLAQTAGAESS